MACHPKRVKQDSNNTNAWQVNHDCIFISLERWMWLQAELNFHEQNNYIQLTFLSLVQVIFNVLQGDTFMNASLSLSGTVYWCPFI